VSISRREILGGGATAAAVGWMATADAATGRLQVGTLAELVVGAPRWFTWPDGRSPAVLLKLGRPVPGGVGPDRDVVAYSAVCTHLGCVVQVKDDRLVCPCHWSMFDPAVGGRCYQGPAPTALPRIVLEVDDDGSIAAVGSDGVVWGRLGPEVQP